MGSTINSLTTEKNILIYIMNKTLKSHQILQSLGGELVFSEEKELP